MQFQTPVIIPKAQWQITYQDVILLLGSCFSDHIAGKLGESYFRYVANPFGTLYNPLSIAQALALRKVPELMEWGGLYHSMYHHGDFSFADYTQAEQACRESIDVLQTAFAQASVVLITFGTAWVYEYEGKVVANCHKMPASAFVRKRLTVEEITDAWQPILSAYPDKHFVFTVSPIRHIKDGLHENQLSKAVLLQAIDSLVIAYPDHVSYFPSYEIVLDELRDYRFYAEDMLHPNAVAVQYIWERFVEAYISDATQQEMPALQRLYRSRHHRLLHLDSPESVAFLSKLREEEDALRERYPWI